MSLNIASNTAWASAGPGAGSAVSRRISRKACSPIRSKRPSTVSGTPTAPVECRVARRRHGGAVECVTGALVPIAPQESEHAQNETSCSPAAGFN